MSEKIDEKEFDIEGDEKTQRGLFFRLFSGIVAIVVIVGLLYISGVYQYFLYSRTPSSVSQDRIESRVDAEILTVPLTVFIVNGDQLYGSVRDEDNVLNLVENASRIWEQAGVSLSIENIYSIHKSSEEIKDMYNNPDLFIETFPQYDEETINVFLVGNLGGINGIAFGGLRAVAVADYTTVYDFRALAHEIGHILGLPHVSLSRGQLMYQGANGSELSLEEIGRAREKAQKF